MKGVHGPSPKGLITADRVQIPLRHFKRINLALRMFVIMHSRYAVSCHDNKWVFALGPDNARPNNL